MMKSGVRKIGLILLILVVYACEGPLNEDIADPGQYTFWSNFDGPPIDIYIDNAKYGTIKTFYQSNPGCNAQGCVTVELDPGTYDFSAIEQTNSTITPRSWDGSITIRSSACGTLGLTP